MLDLKDITCMRGGRALFRNFSLAVKSGDIVHLSGPNGAGKTSLLRIISGMLPCENVPENIECCFLPSGDGSLKTAETGRENLSFWADVYGRPHVEAVLARLDIFDIADRPVRHFSAGQKRRLSIARMLLNPAKLWLMDEPFNALDDHAAALVIKIIRDHAAAGGGAIVAGHQPFDGARVVPLGGAA